MTFRVLSGNGAAKMPTPSGFQQLHRDGRTRVEADEPALIAGDAQGRTAILFGRMAGLHSGGGLRAITLPAALLAARMTADARQWTRDIEGRFVLVLVESDGRVTIAADQFGKRDVFLKQEVGTAIAASSLSVVPDPASGGFDQPSLAHVLTYYGNRPPKRHTIYKSVRRLGVGDIATLNDGKLGVEVPQFRPVRTARYGGREHHLYADAFLEHLSASGSTTGNVVLLSSGWDSTAVLAGLVHVFGRRKVRAVIGRMLYSERSGNCNRFEIERARAMAEYFDVPIEIADLDHGVRGNLWLDRVRPVFRDHQFFSITGVNHFVLTEHAARASSGGEVLFAGEISDGAHNLGFSQYVTIFHPSYEFREYADKMASYLFGPTFVRQFLDNCHEDDPVYKLFRSRTASVEFDAPASTRPERMLQIMISFFLRNGRMPLWSLTNCRLLTAVGRDLYTAEMAKSYLTGVESAEPEELYSWYLHLYNSFHWQGSTVATLQTMADKFDMASDLPFWNAGIQGLLSAMPENWGRGLDLNPTKFPLKWMLANRLDYPMHLQVGPHSYTYDVDPTFNHNFELFYYSAMAPTMRNLLKHRPYRKILDANVFDIDYADNVVEDYINGEAMTGLRLNDLVSLALLCNTGWHG